MHPGQIFILLVAARSHLSVVSWRNATARQSWESGAGPLIDPILETDMRYFMPQKTSLQRYSRAEGQSICFPLQFVRRKDEHAQTWLRCNEMFCKHCNSIVCSSQYRHPRSFLEHSILPQIRIALTDGTKGWDWGFKGFSSRFPTPETFRGR